VPRHGIRRSGDPKGGQAGRPLDGVLHPAARFVATRSQQMAHADGAHVRQGGQRLWAVPKKAAIQQPSTMRRAASAIRVPLPRAEARADWLTGAPARHASCGGPASTTPTIWARRRYHSTRSPGEASASATRALFSRQCSLPPAVTAQTLPFLWAPQWRSWPRELLAVRPPPPIRIHEPGRAARRLMLT